MDLQTSLLIIAPPEVQAFAAPILQQFAPSSCMQGPAHITLFYPFVPLEEVDPTVEKLNTICLQIQPLHLNLNRYGRFDTTHYLAPSNPEPILELHRLLLSTFPEYPPYEGQHGPELVPHLTLTQMESKAEADQISLPPVPSFSFTVHQLHLYIGPEEGNTPWIPHSIIPLAKEA